MDNRDDFKGLVSREQALEFAQKRVEEKESELRSAQEQLNRLRADVAYQEGEVRAAEERLRSAKLSVAMIEGKPTQESRSDEYAGLPIIEAIVKCLTRLGKPSHLQNEVLPSLVAGGALQDTPNNAKWRILRMTISKNPSRVQLDKKTDIASLPGPKIIKSGM